jgi:ubiquinone/menaquinone biosynthesis C-methylase UbiE
MIDETKLAEVLEDGVELRQIEPYVYSVIADDEDVEISYDKKFGYFYDLIACSPAYNFIVWGYRISEYHSFCLEALQASADGWVLDDGCGSLAFTAKTYAGCATRPVVFLDRSMRLLRMAKKRLEKRCGLPPDNVVFLHGDALQLPFRTGSFATLISLNLLHVLEDLPGAVGEMGRVLAPNGTIALTTLVESDRLADRYLHIWGRAGELIPRRAEPILAAFEAIDVPVECSAKGNLAFIRHLPVTGRERQ